MPEFRIAMSAQIWHQLFHEMTVALGHHGHLPKKRLASFLPLTPILERDFDKKLNTPSVKIADCESTHPPPPLRALRDAHYRPRAACTW